MKNIFLKIQNLSCGYGPKFMIKNINIQIEQNEMIGIIGPNGSGKTTFLKSLTKTLTPEKGEILLENKNIQLMNNKELAKKVAVVSQNLSPSAISVNDFVLMGRLPYFNNFQFFESSTDIELAEKYLKLVKIHSIKNKPLSEISGGEQQLAYIAKALAQEPKLLLLDEPTSHLDISHQIQIMDLIRELNKKLHITVIIVLHDLNSASEYCDRLILLNKGIIHKTGTPEEVLTYQIIEKVYKTIVIVEKNPLSLKPYILLVSKNNTNKAGKKHGK